MQKTLAGKILTPTDISCGVLYGSNSVHNAHCKSKCCDDEGVSIFSKLCQYARGFRL